jgi:hypothetical protein
MAITAEKLIANRALTPEMFSTQIIDPERTEDEQKADLIAHVESEIIAKAKSQLTIPVRTALGGRGLPLTSAFVESKLPDSSEEDVAAIIQEVNDLADAAIESYASSEINKQVASNADEYDSDSDQDRIQGNNKRDSLIAFLKALVSGSLTPANESDDGVPVVPYLISTVGSVESVW